MDSDKVHATPVYGIRSESTDSVNTQQDEEFIGDESDSDTDMETMMAEVNRQDPTFKTQITFTKDRTTFQTSDDDLSQEMSDASLESKYVDKEVVEQAHSSAHHHHHDGAPCECKESKHVSASEQEAQAISVAEKE